MSLISSNTKPAMIKHWPSKALVAVLLIAFVGSLSACGKKSALEKPPSKSEQTKAIKKTS